MSYNIAIDGHILSVVQSQSIKEQSELQAILGERGYHVPQATLSRRLKKLNIAKVADIYKIINFNSPYLPIILNISVSKFGLIVLHTHPGNAGSLASFIDSKYVEIKRVDSGVLGTIAGDDTVLIVIHSEEDLQPLLMSLQADFPYLVMPGAKT